MRKMHPMSTGKRLFKFKDRQLQYRSMSLMVLSDFVYYFYSVLKKRREVKDILLNKNYFNFGWCTTITSNAVLTPVYRQLIV
jgi:hypothetical protein